MSNNFLLRIIAFFHVEIVMLKSANSYTPEPGRYRSHQIPTNQVVVIENTACTVIAIPYITVIANEVRH
jgi:hypothetical protein